MYEAVEKRNRDEITKDVNENNLKTEEKAVVKS